MEKRRGRERHEGLSAIGFDPSSDLALTDNGLWRWATDRPDLHGYVRDYFVARDEDSQAVEAGSQ